MSNKTTRREFIKTTTAVGLAAVGSFGIKENLLPSVQAKVEYDNCLLDRLWVWAHQIDAYKNAFKLPGATKFQPIDGVRYLGVPNVVMVGYNDIPQPPFDAYYKAQHFEELKRIYWSFVGASGRTSLKEQEGVLDLIRQFPNIKGVFMDDFFRGLPKKGEDLMPASCTLAQLEKIRKDLAQTGTAPDLGVTLYTKDLVPQIKKHLEFCDVISFWTWKADDLKDLEKNFALYRRLIPQKRTLLGIYMWDFCMGKPISLDKMELQCELGRQWLREGKIEGMIFLATNICDLGLDAVAWSKDWIARHKNERL